MSKNNRTNKPRTRLVGPLRCEFHGTGIIVRLAVPKPRTNRWPLEFEMDVAEALDRVLEDYPRTKVRLRGWKPTREKCAFIAAKMKVYEAIWKDRGWYFVGPQFARERHLGASIY